MGSTQRSRNAWLAIAAVGMLVAGCGSRVAPSDQAAGRQGTDLTAGAGDGAGVEDGLGTEVAGDVGTADGGVAAGGTGATRRTGSGTAATGAGSAATGGAREAGSTAAAAAQGASAQGVTDKEILVGAVYDKNAGATNAAFGFTGIGQLDTKRAWETMIADINKRGGVAGRKLKLVFYVGDSTSGKSSETVAQEICSTFTQDNKVFAAFISGIDTLRTCLSKAGVVQVGFSSGLSDSTTFNQFPYLVETNQPALDRKVRFEVARLVEMGFYKEGKGAPAPFKLGLIRYDDPVFTRASGALKSALAARGLTLSEEIAIKRAGSTAEIGDEANAIRSAALQFNEKKVTHVEFLMTNNAFGQLTFMQNAEKQLYRPRYGLTSNDGGQALATLLGDSAQAQLSKALLVGWFPLFDVRAADYSGDKTTPAFRRCIDLLKSAGETFGDGDPTRNKEAQASAIICDPANYFKAAMDAGGPVVNTETWLQGVAKVSGLDSAATFVLTTTSERRDAVGAVRDDRWFDDCSCFKYTSDNIPQ